MTAVMNNAAIDRDQLLGYMAFYYMPGVKLKQVELEAIFAGNQMDDKYLPKKIYGNDAFRRVTGKIRGSVNVTQYDPNTSSNNLVEARLNIDEVRNDNDEIVRTLGRKIINSANDTVEYETVGKFVYDKHSESASYDVDTQYANEYDWEGQYFIPTCHEYTDAMIYHSRDTLRTIVNRIFQAQNPVTIIKGAYFIPLKYEDELMALNGVINDLAKYATDTGELPEMRIIPLLDTVEQRELIEKKASGELSKQLDDIMVELATTLTDQKELKNVTLLRLNTTFQSLRDKTNEYSALLNLKLANTEALFTRALELFTEVKAIPSMVGIGTTEAGI
jgi:hypothetical protein